MSDENNKLPILSEGDEALGGNNLAYKPRFMKANESFKGRFVSLRFVKFKQHGQFVKKGDLNNIQSHACTLNDDCPSCKAGVPASFPTLVFLWNADKGELVVRDLKKVDGLKKARDNYGEDLLTGAYEISLSDKGEFSVALLPPKVAKDVAATPADLVIDDDVLRYCMNVRKPADMAKLFEGKAIVPREKSGKKGEDTSGVVITRTDDDTPV